LVDGQRVADRRDARGLGPGVEPEREPGQAERGDAEPDLHRPALVPRQERLDEDRDARRAEHDEQRRHRAQSIGGAVTCSTWAR
jgi:hypothetical protein